jgi:hypothetical protein
MTRFASIAIEFPTLPADQQGCSVASTELESGSIAPEHALIFATSGILSICRFNLPPARAATYTNWQLG